MCRVWRNLGIEVFDQGLQIFATLFDHGAIFAVTGRDEGKPTSQKRCGSKHQLPVCIRQSQFAERQ
jgi:hypothetical protein